VYVFFRSLFLPAQTRVPAFLFADFLNAFLARRPFPARLCVAAARGMDACWYWATAGSGVWAASSTMRVNRLTDNHSSPYHRTPGRTAAALRRRKRHQSSASFGSVRSGCWCTWTATSAHSWGVHVRSSMMSACAILFPSPFYYPHQIIRSF